MRLLRGMPASPGLGMGPADPVHPMPSVDPEARRTAPAKSEAMRLGAAIEQAAARLEALAARTSGEMAEILLAQREMLADPELRQEARALVDEGFAAEAAVTRVAAAYAEQLAALPDPYLSARAADVREAGERIVAALRGDVASLRLEQPSVLVARDLSPAEVVLLDPALLLGIVTELGVPSGHLAIVAQGLGVPAVVGVADALVAVAEGEALIVDGEVGTVIVAPDAAGRAAAELRAAAQRREVLELDPYRERPGLTADGVRVVVFANVGSLAEVRLARAAGAEGVGLFRSELLAAEGMPSEEAQLAAYREAAEILGRPLVVRSFDLGGDKPVPGLALPAEQNPFLGWRGIRLALDRPDELFLPQARALLRLAATHDVRLLMPMVATIEEVDQARALLARARAELERRGQPCGALPLGIMVETPAAALTLDRFVGRVDFSSLGTNDLVQYTYAVDRTNAQVRERARPLGLAILRLVEHVCRSGLPIAACGQLAAEPEAIPLLIGLGVRELSVPPARVTAVKREVGRRTLAEMQALAREALAAG